MPQRMNELATQAANGTNYESDCDAIQAEIDQLTTEIDRVSETTKFNETYLLKGDTAGTTVEQQINAHDAGIDGKLVDNGSTASFTKVLADGDKIKIAGEEYTIGVNTGEILKAKDMNSSTDGYVDLAIAADFTDVATLVAGDSFAVDGENYTLTDTISLKDITTHFATGDLFQIGEHYYKIAAVLADGEQVRATKFSGVKEDGTKGSAVTKPSDAKTVYTALDALVKGNTITIGKDAGAKTYTIVDDGDEEDADAFKLHKDTILAMIHDSNTANYTGAANAVTVIGDIGAPAENDSTEKTRSL